MSDGADKIVIRKEELDDPKVDEALAQQLSFGTAVARDLEPEKKTRLIHKPWFALMLAGAVGAFLAWALVEPFFSDGVRFEGRIERIDPEARVPLTKGSVRGTIEVSGTTVWILDGTSRVWRDGERVPLDTLERGALVAARGEVLTLQHGGKVLLGVEVRVLKDDGAARERVDLGSLSLRQMIVGFSVFPIVAAFVGLFIGAADGLLSRALHRALICGLVGLGVGLGVGLLADLFAELLYAVGTGFVHQVDTGTAGDMSTAAFLVQMMTRGLAWSLAGAAMGLGQGIALRSTKLLVNGLLGGMAGALLGGLLFDPIDYLLKSGDMLTGGAGPSRGIGFVIIGMATGFMIGVVELLAREAWCKMLTGPLAGKEFVLYRNPTVLGSSPKSDIFLFKDPEVEPQHALVHTIGEGYEVEDKGSGAGTWVNGKKVKRQRLSNGDQIRIGKTVLSFSVKEAE